MSFLTVTLSILIQMYVISSLDGLDGAMPVCIKANLMACFTPTTFTFEYLVHTTCTLQLVFQPALLSTFHREVLKKGLDDRNPDEWGNHGEERGRFLKQTTHKVVCRH